MSQIPCVFLNTFISDSLNNFFADFLINFNIPQYEDPNFNTNDINDPELRVI